MANYLLKILKNLEIEIPQYCLDDIKCISNVYEFIKTEVDTIKCPVSGLWSFDNWIKYAQNGEFKALANIAKHGNNYIREFKKNKSISFDTVFKSFGLDMRYRDGYLKTRPKCDDIYYPHKLEILTTSKKFKVHQLFYYSNPKEVLTTNIGCYFIYDKDNQDNVVYVGKSNSDLLSRACQSARERTSGMFSRIKLCEMITHADTNIYELYYIAKYKPKHNVDSTCDDYPTSDLPEIGKCHYIELIGEKEFNIEHINTHSKIITKEEFWSDEKYLLNDEMNKKILIESELKQTEGYDKYMKLKDELDAMGFLTFSNYFYTKNENMEENNK